MWCINVSTHDRKGRAMHVKANKAEASAEVLHLSSIKVCINLRGTRHNVKGKQFNGKAFCVPKVRKVCDDKTTELMWRLSREIGWARRLVVDYRGGGVLLG